LSLCLLSTSKGSERGEEKKTKEGEKDPKDGGGASLSLSRALSTTVVASWTLSVFLDKRGAKVEEEGEKG